MTDRELEMNMNAMGPDYSGTSATAISRATSGVLVLSHGVGENSDRGMKKSMEPLAAKQPDGHRIRHVHDEFRAPAGGGE